MSVQSWSLLVFLQSSSEERRLWNQIWDVSPTSSIHQSTNTKAGQHLICKFVSCQYYYSTGFQADSVGYQGCEHTETFWRGRSCILNSAAWNKWTNLFIFSENHPFKLKNLQAKQNKTCCLCMLSLLDNQTNWLIEVFFAKFMAKLPLSSSWPWHVSNLKNVGKYHVDCYLGLLKYVVSLLPSVQFVQEVIKGF